MPVCEIGYTPGPGREELALELAGDLPDMVVVMMDQGAGVTIQRRGLSIDITASHPKAYNKPTLEIVVSTGRGREAVYARRELMRSLLKGQVQKWLDKHPELCNAAALDDVDVDVRFVDMCGVNFDASTGEPRSQWGAPGDN
jgi:hypothetical protein